MLWYNFTPWIPKWFSGKVIHRLSIDLYFSTYSGMIQVGISFYSMVLNYQFKTMSCYNMYKGSFNTEFRGLKTCGCRMPRSVPNNAEGWNFAKCLKFIVIVQTQPEVKISKNPLYKSQVSYTLEDWNMGHFNFLAICINSSRIWRASPWCCV